MPKLWNKRHKLILPSKHLRLKLQKPSNQSKRLSLYCKTTVKKPTESSEAISAKQTSSAKQLNPATCTKPSIVQQQSYSTMTSSQTSTDKTACTTTKQPPSKQAIATSTNPNFDRMDVKQIKAFISLQVFKSPLTANLNLFSCLKQFIDLFMDLPTEPDFESESIDECLSRCLTPLAGQKLLYPFQMASFPNDFSQLPPFGLMGIFDYLIMSKPDYDKSMLSSWRSFEEYKLCANGHFQSLRVNATKGLDGSIFLCL